MVRISCIKPDRVIELFDGKVVKGITFHYVNKLGLQVTLKYENEADLDEDIIKKKIKEFMEEDEIFRALIVNIEILS